MLSFGLLFLETIGGPSLTFAEMAGSLLDCSLQVGK